MNYYYSANDYYRDEFGEKIYKISLNGGFTCPNRDGTLSSLGCTFCSEGGSGDFSPSASMPITQQIDHSIAQISQKYHGTQYIAYFQSFTNTYGTVSYLSDLYSQVISDPRICGLSIGTRPDCLSDEIIELLSCLNQSKKIYIELGLQTIHEVTALRINRGYSLAIFEDSLRKLNQASIPVIIHVIIGLPGETHNDLMKTINYLSSLNIHGIKLQLLHVLKNTPLAKEFIENPFPMFDQQTYVNTVIDCVQRIPPNWVVYRITGDGPKSLLIAPLWSTNKKAVLNSILAAFKTRNAFQGQLLFKEDTQDE